jgi:two-component system LytT family response regulator
MKIVIVDDELHAREALKKIITSTFPEHEVVACEENLPDGVKALMKFKPDLVFLDIDMPRYSGLELLDFVDVREFNTAVVFVTAYSQYAVNAFEMSAVDYILKPVGIEAVRRALSKIKEKQPDFQNLSILKNNLEGNRFSKIAISIAHGIQLVDPEDLLYLKADGSYTQIKLTNNEKLTTSKNLQSYMALEENMEFSRVNRSYIINLNRVKKVIKSNGGTVIMEDDEEISISPEQRLKIEEYFKANSF